jgi:hypothetical protein
LGRRSDVRAAAKVGVERARQSRTLEALREGYAKNGQALWDYARAVIKELPEAERQAEMQEIKRLLERAGFPESGH